MRQPFSLMLESEPVQNRLAGLEPNALSQFRISQKAQKLMGETSIIFRFNQPTIYAVLNDFINSLPATTDDRLSSCHRFQVNAAERFIGTGQRENTARAQQPCYL